MTSITIPDRDRNIARYNSKYRLLTSYMQKCESRVNLARRQPSLDVLVGMIGATTDLDIIGNEKRYLLVTDSWYILKIRDFRTRVEIKTLESERLTSIDFHAGFWIWPYMSLILCCVAHLWALPDGWEEVARRAAPSGRGGHSGVFYFRRTWLPWARRMWLAGFHRLRYDTYLTAPIYDLKDTAGSLYEVSFAVVNKPGAGSR